LSIADIEIHRVYKCDNEECAAEIVVTQIAKDPWLKQCPFCYEETLFIRSATDNLSIFIDLKKPKTLGSLGEQNFEEKVKREGDPKEEPKKPWWRKNKEKVDFSILKNPKKYIETGHI